MLDIIFYFQILFTLAIILYAFYTKTWYFFALAGVFVILTGTILASGEPIEYATGGLTMVESFNADGNVTKFVPDYNSFDVGNSNPVYMWSQVLMYGGFMFLIIAFLMAIVGLKRRRDEQREEDGW